MGVDRRSYEMGYQDAMDRACPALSYSSWDGACGPRPSANGMYVSEYYGNDYLFPYDRLTSGGN